MRGDPDLSAYPPPPGWDDYDPLPDSDFPPDEPSFFRWLVRHSWRFDVDHHDLLGGIAHDVYYDECLPGTNDLSDLLIHIRVQHDASDDNVRALVGAYVEWATDRATRRATDEDWRRFQKWLAEQEPSS